MLSRYRLWARRAADEWLSWPGFNFMWGHVLLGGTMGAAAGLVIGLLGDDGLAEVGPGFAGGVAVSLIWALSVVSYARLRGAR